MKDQRSSARAASIAVLCAFTTLLSTAAAVGTVLLLVDSRATSTLSPASSAVAALQGQVGELQSSLEALSERLRQLESAPSISLEPRSLAERAPNGASPPLERRTEEGQAGDRDALDPRAPGRSARLGGEQLEKLMRLRREGDEAERLALARAILASETGIGRWMALEVLIELDPAEGLRGLRAMIERGDGGDPRSGAGQWESAFRSLARTSGIDLRSELTALYAIGDDAVKGAAARVLQQQGDDSLTRQYLAVLEAKLRSTEVGERLGAIEQVANLDGTDGNRLVSPLLADASPRVRLRALEGLRRLGGDDVTAQVERLVDDPDERVRQCATHMLETMRAQQRLFTEAREGRRQR